MRPKIENHRLNYGLASVWAHLRKIVTRSSCRSILRRKLCVCYHPCIRGFNFSGFLIFINDTFYTFLLNSEKILELPLQSAVKQCIISSSPIPHLFALTILTSYPDNSVGRNKLQISLLRFPVY